MSRVVLVPGVLALLPEYAGLVDPVADLRAACREAVAWLVEAASTSITVLADEQGGRVAAHLLAEAGFGGALGSAADAGSGDLLVVANGSARRSEKAPGHLDDRAVAFDTALASALHTPDPAALQGIDAQIAGELLVGNAPGLRALGARLTTADAAVMNYGDDPFGVQYWVMRWTCVS